MPLLQVRVYGLTTSAVADTSNGIRAVFEEFERNHGLRVLFTLMCYKDPKQRTAQGIVRNEWINGKGCTDETAGGGSRAGRGRGARGTRTRRPVTASAPGTIGSSVLTR